MENVVVLFPSFLGDTVHHKKSVYEPTRHQRCQQLICSRSWAITILVLLGMLLIFIASLAAFARPECQACSPTSEHCLTDQQPQKHVPTTPKPDFISKNGEEYPWKDVRLPSFVIPKSYKLIMHPNISKSEYHGEVTIDLEVKKETDFIVFHAIDFNITNYSVTSNDKTISVKKHLQYETFEQFYLQLERKIQPSENLKLSVMFKGELKPKLHGFYKSSYKTKAGEQRHIAVTHFEPTDAREAFPCFDEPAFKATFELSITRDSQHITLFNMPLKSSENQANGLIVDHYETSKRMSTYLVAFVVCDFGHIHKTTKDGVKVRVYAPKDMIYQADFALDAAVKILEYYNTFFGVPYPLPKQDLIAIPDFQAGAMENWGLITYRLSALLFDPKTSSLTSKQWVATVVAHELAHQWFGDLVTMKWWDDLWLNEGFASYVEYLGADIVLPEFRMNDQFLLKDFQLGLNLDSLSTSHPIQVHVSNPDQINEIFDTISYNKGSSLLRMLRFSLGEEEFKNGLSSYLEKYQFGNAETKDLWQSLQSESNLNVKDIMDTWTLQMGYPLVTVKHTDNTVTLSQERYLFNKQQPEKSEFTSPYNYKWYIPFTYVTDKSPSTKKTIWMNKTSVTIPFDSSSRWIKGNFGVNGFYRVDYGDIWHELILQLRNNHQLFDKADRAGLLDDVYMLSRSDKVDVTTALDMTQYLEKENDYIVWSTVTSGQFNYLFSQLRYEESYSDLQAYVQKLINKQIKIVGWKDDGDILKKYLRTLILNLAERVGHKDTIKEGKAQFKKWKDNRESINQNLTSVILTIGIKYGDRADWDFVWNRYKQTQVPSERDLLVRVLTETQDVHVINM
ncbi:hypothetical protein LOTGIDRAFT_218512 [Lottia gigantea]|uniref:Aminopeptidase n=1 Tax=Lottia gigantea TaxID=225164 RepID=V4BLS2_LOTGI|nr:hypothetical protein LOTGIDRAFT_218512 [Lottia gigantea]ESO89719.1 hypothetical protein LOTGIDRAFT_218512 [Lottia gigantea]